MTAAVGTFRVASWQEDTYEEGEAGAKLTRATVSLDFSGGIEGNAAVQWLMSYRADGTARFVGLAQVKGSVGGRAGAFVLESTGEFDGTVARGQWSVVAGSGAGELEGVRGTGGFEAGREATYTLDYELG